jgi:hypothetical protein
VLRHLPHKHKDMNNTVLNIVNFALYLKQNHTTNLYKTTRLEGVDGCYIVGKTMVTVEVPKIGTFNIYLEDKEVTIARTFTLASDEQLQHIESYISRLADVVSKTVNAAMMAKASESCLGVQKIRNTNLYYISYNSTPYYFDADLNNVTREDNQAMQEEEALDVIIYVGELLQAQAAIQAAY